MSVEVAVPEGSGPELQLRYAGSDPVTYTVVDDRVEVAEEHLSEFLMAIVGSYVYVPPPPEPAKPAKEK